MVDPKRPDAIVDLMQAGLCDSCTLEVVTELTVHLLELRGRVDLCPDCHKAIDNWLNGRAR
jgi:hypothetical protein